VNVALNVFLQIVLGVRCATLLLLCDNVGAKPKAEVVADILASIKERRA